MTPVEYGIIAVFLVGLYVGHAIGLASAQREEAGNRAFDRWLEQKRRDELARSIDEGIAAAHSRPQLHGVAEVVPFRRPGDAA